MAGDTEQDELGYRVLRAIRRIIRQVSRHSRNVAAETGVNLPQLLVLQTIAADEAGEATGARVADRVHLSRSTVSVLVDKLVKAGLVDRVRSERDRRHVHLSLTASGRERLDERPPPLEDRFLARLAALETGEREQILAALERVVTLMDADDVEASPHLVPGDQLASMVPPRTPIT